MRKIVREAIDAARRTANPNRTAFLKRYRQEWTIYLGIRSRCKDNWNQLYGGRGIECRFQTFESFMAELGPRPSSAHSVDRIDNNGHYEAGNVRWALRDIQDSNKRHQRRNSITVWHRDPAVWDEIVKGTYKANRKKPK